MFNDAPEQPIRYMESSERFAVFIMYDYSVHDKFSQMITVFQGNEICPCNNVFIDEQNVLVRPPHRVFLSEYKRSGSSDKVCIMGIYVRVPLKK